MVSIIVPVYNSEKYLDKCIKSITCQTYRNIEIILINDGSKDNSPDICDMYAACDNRIKVIHKINTGVSHSRNIGLKLCTGDFIVFVDSDDWLEPDMIRHMMNIQVINDYDIVMTGIYENNLPLNKITEINYETKGYSGKSELASIIPKIIKDGTINQLLSKLYKADLIKGANIRFNNNLNLAEDALFNYEAFFEAESFYISDRCLYHYAIREDDSLSKRFNPLKYDMLVYVNDRLNELIKDNSHYINAAPSAEHIRFKNIYSCILDLFNKNHSLTYTDKRSVIRNILSKESFKRYYILENKLYRLLAFILSLKNITLTYAVTWAVHVLRRLSSWIRNKKYKKTRIWHALRQIKHFLFHRRRLIPKNLTVAEFLGILKQKNCRYVVLRWFDKLPNQWYGDDIDILVSDEDSKKVISMLTRSTKKGGMPCDVYSVSGKKGLGYRGTCYYPPAKAAEMLQNSITIRGGILVPSPEDYFYSLAYHAVYHKGLKSGLPAGKNEPPSCWDPEHDFTSILSEMAQKLNIDIDINMESLKAALNKKGWSPSPEMLKRYLL